jgi:uncharacterized paraquat-inducible protein A
MCQNNGYKWDYGQEFPVVACVDDKIVTYHEMEQRCPTCGFTAKFRRKKEEMTDA